MTAKVVRAELEAVNRDVFKWFNQRISRGRNNAGGMNAATSCGTTRVGYGTVTVNSPGLTT